MMEDLKTLIERITGIAEKAHVNMVFGEPKDVQGRVLIPVAEVSYGFGLGLGSGSSTCTCECHDEPGAGKTAEEVTASGSCGCDDEPCACCTDDGASEGSFGGGGGGGAKVRPLAYIEVRPEGTRVVAIEDEQKIALMGILMIMWCVGWIGLVLKSLFKK